MQSTATVVLHGKTLSLPNPLRFQNGEPVAGPGDWARRRDEILELFRTNVYGCAPVDRPAELAFDVSPIALPSDGAIMRKQIAISCGDAPIADLIVYLPTAAPAPMPCFLLLSNQDLEHGGAPTDFWPVARLAARGYAAAALRIEQIAPDKPGAFHEGVHGLFDPPGPRAADAWGALGAWAWGASRALDYLQTDPAIDPGRIAVLGHSRAGKAALWVGAQDERFALTISNDSGCSGAALARGSTGENIKAITSRFGYWFCENYKQWADREAELPLDQHMLLALIAPRLLYIASASQDQWANPESEFASAVAASPVYQMLGLAGVGAAEMPEPEMPRGEGHIGHHIRRGGHALLPYDWERFMDFADRHMIGVR